MIKERKAEWRNDYDKVTVGLYFVLLIIGYIMIYAAEYNPEHPSIFDFSRSYGRQFLWITIALTAGGVALLLETNFYRAFAFGFYGLAILSLLIVLIFAPEVNGARAWLDLGSFKFQAGEFTKPAVCLAVAAYLSGHGVSFNDWNTRLKAFALIFLPMAMIIFQKDTGTALVYISFFVLFFREGMPALPYIVGIVLFVLSVLALMLDNPLYILLGLSILGSGIFLFNRSLHIRWYLPILAGLGASVYLVTQGFLKEVLIANAILTLILAIAHYKRSDILTIFLSLGLVIAATYTYSVNYVFYKVLEPHQQDRIMVWLRPEKSDPQGALYNVIQSKSTIGSGGLLGKGFLQGERTKLNYVPEQSTDFIFCTVGEEHGFLGNTIVILLFMTLILRVIYLAERQRSHFTRLYAYGVAGILFIHFLVNIGMTMGVTPVMGIPLPFVSYGGSSLISFTFLLAILIKLDSDRFVAFR